MSPLRSVGSWDIQAGDWTFERGSKELKTELAQGGPLSSSPLRSDDSHDGQVGGWTMLKVAKDTRQENWKTTPGSQGT